MKKIKFKKPKIVLSLVAFLLLSVNTQAQTLEDALGFTETVNDVPEAPIHLLIPVALAIGGYFGIKELKK